MNASGPGSSVRITSLSSYTYMYKRRPDQPTNLITTVNPRRNPHLTKERRRNVHVQRLGPRLHAAAADDDLNFPHAGAAEEYRGLEEGDDEDSGAVVVVGSTSDAFELLAVEVRWDGIGGEEVKAKSKEKFCACTTCNLVTTIARRCDLWVCTYCNNWRGRGGRSGMLDRCTSSSSTSPELKLILWRSLAEFSLPSMLVWTFKL